MRFLKKCIEVDKYYTWQLKGTDYTCTFTTITIKEAFDRMRKIAADRKENIILYLYKDEKWLEFSFN